MRISGSRAWPPRKREKGLARPGAEAHPMSLFLQPLYTSKRGYYTIRELQYLSLSLGHDENLFGRILKKLSLNKARYSDEEINGWLDSNILDDDLHYVFNRHSARYNVKVFKRTIHYLKHRHLTFGEIMCGRLVYELVTVVEPFQLPLEVKPVSEALKLCDKIISPLRLQHLFHSMRKGLDSKGKLALYDFFEIIGFSENISSARQAMTAECQRRGSTMHLDETETDYNQIRIFLNDKYKTSIIKPDKKFLHSSEITEKVQAIIARSKLSTATQKCCPSPQQKAEYKRLSPLISSSAKLLVQARAGHHVLSAEQGNNALTRLYCQPPL